MKKKHNYKQNKHKSAVDNNININNATKEVADELEVLDNKSDDVDIDDVDIDDVDIDEDMAERLAYYESVAEDDDKAESEIIDQDGEISEFISRDYDVIAESRRRVNQPGSPVERVGRTGNSKNGKKGINLDKNKPKKTKINKDSNASFITKLVEIYHKYTMQILYSALGILAAILLVVIIVTLATGEPESDESKTETNTTSQQEESTADEEESTQEQTTAPALVPEAEDSEIQTLVASYIDAAFIKADMEQVKLYVDDVTNINVDEYKSRQKYIEAYQNIKCYKFEHDEAGTYVVFVTYDEKIYNIETPAPSGKLFIIKKNPEDQKLYIHNMTEDEELDVYIASKAQQISTLSADVSKRLEAAKDADEELKAVLDLMGNVGKSSEETSSAAQE